MTFKRLVLIPIFALLWVVQVQPAASQTSSCDPMGWFPEDFGLKDHTVFYFDNFYYLASIYLPREKQFAYGRSQDFCNWEDLGPILTERTSGDWDEAAIWAPFVLEQNGTYYMYYTGVTRNITQSIMLATTTNPADPTSWQEQGMIFQPAHPGAVWQVGEWADCRDPIVLVEDGVYYLYYTGRDQDGGIVGLATATSPAGPWEDLGPVTEPLPLGAYESPSVVRYQNTYYMVIHEKYLSDSLGAFSLISSSPFGPFEAPYPLAPGWAHEVWQDTEGGWKTSYLMSYQVTIAPITWNDFLNPPRPFIGEEIHRVFLTTVFQP